MSPTRTANPAPRRALRKADDSHVHPATTRPAALTPVPGDLTAEHAAGVPAPEPAPTLPAVKADPKAKDPKAGGKKARTRPAAEASKVAGATKTAGATKRSDPEWDKRFHGNTADVLRAKSTTHDLLRGPEATLEVRIPKRLRKAARVAAQGHDTSVDQIVTRLLADWLESL